MEAATAITEKKVQEEAKANIKGTKQTGSGYFCVETHLVDPGLVLLIKADPAELRFLLNTVS